ncbi:MAG TPA: hypothetical protein VN843_09965, partial [Anaerolineales bacterium]|nr:hypothetical protein [Anaerolineales bacterium]
QTNLAERADQAHKERKRTDRKKATKKTAKGVGHIIRGNNQYANTTALVGVGTVSYLYNKKNQSVKHEEDGMKDTVELGAEFLEHHGVKGMRWGQRKEKIAVAREQKRAKKHDAKFERPDAQTHALIHNLAVVGFNNKIESINSKPHYDEAAKKGELDNEKLPITKQYHNEVNQLFKNELQSAANGVRNYSGSRQYDVEFTRLSPDPHDWGWSVKTRPVTDGTAGSGELVKVSHADDATIFRAIMDDNGLITGVALTEMSQSIFGELFVDDILSHHGVKGMKWGVRQHREGTLRRKAADQRAKAERAPKALIGTKAHKESVASKLNKQADKNEAKADQLARNIEKTGELRTKGVAKAKGGLRKLGRGINAVAVVLADSSWQNSTYSDAKHEAVHNHVAKELDSHIEKLQRSPKYRG